MARDGGKIIADGNERVLRARLSDAKFFWDQDRKTTLESRLPALKGIVFHAKLGTQAERVERIVKLAGEIAKFVPGADAKQVEQAARLAKADLVTGMVGEFPELQGIMGRYYALGEKLPAAVADAIGDHYAPAGPNDRCPTRRCRSPWRWPTSSMRSTSFWAIGEKPTGSRDPFALRRAALGIIRIVVENKIRLPLETFFKADDLMDFFAERLKVQMREKGVRHDVVDAVFALGTRTIWCACWHASRRCSRSSAARPAGICSLPTAVPPTSFAPRRRRTRDGGEIAGAPDVALLEQVEEKAVVTP